MCSQFEIDSSIDHIRTRFETKELKTLITNEMVRPTNTVTVIKPSRITKDMSWGLVNSWSKQPIINARSETLKEKKTFQPLLEKRCLIPATAYFEWNNFSGKNSKFRISSQIDEIFGIAGLFEKDKFVILTCQPNLFVSQVHNRMPVILMRANEEKWLDPISKFKDVKYLLKPDSLVRLKHDKVVRKREQIDLFE